MDQEEERLEKGVSLFHFVSDMGLGLPYIVQG
jgi:hypothetical protein